MSSNTPYRTRVSPYGTWQSPLTAARVTAGSLRFDHIVLDGDDVYWLEGRASEAGRNVIVRRTGDGNTSDMTPAGFNVRSRVHEYGGAPYTVDRGAIYFSNFKDQRLYRQTGRGEPQPLTVEGFFYADAAVDRPRARLLCVREDHTTADREPVNTIVAVSSAGHAERVIVSGADFYSDPVLSPDGARLAWLQWNHPNMPWDGTELWVAQLGADGLPTIREKIAGSADESIFQPEWSPDGRLYFVSDRTGWWNLYRARAAAAVEAIHPMPADFGKAQWTFSATTYAFVDANRIVATYTQNGRWNMALIETDSRNVEPIHLELEPTDAVRADARSVYFIGGSPTVARAVVRMALSVM
jgi:hypothetical protein